MAKKPRVNKNKKQILADLKTNAEFQKKMAFARDKFFPALCEATVSIDDATVLLSGFNTQIMQEFLAFMKEKKVKDLQLHLKLDAASDKFLEFQKLLALFEDMSVYEAKDLIEGMRGEIELFKTEEFKSRPLSSLKTTWLEEHIGNMK